MRKPTWVRGCLAGILAVILGTDPWQVAATDLSQVLYTPVPATLVESVLPVDLDLDLDPDLVVLQRRGASPVRILWNDGSALTDVTGSLSLPVLPDGGFRAAAGDVDQDGDPDLVVCAVSGGLSAAAACQLWRNRWVEDGALGFEDVSGPSGFAPTGERAIPVMGDPDDDADADVLLFAWDKGVRSRFWRNDLDDGVLALTALPDSALPAYGSTRHAVPLGDGGRAAEIYLSRADAVDRLVAYDIDAGGYSDASRARGLAPARTPGRAAASADFDADDLPDVFLHGGAAGPTLLLQNASGMFSDRTSEVVGLGGARQLARVVAAEDYDRNRLPDVFIAAGVYEPRALLLNQGPDLVGGAVLEFEDPGIPPSLDGTPFPSAALNSLLPAECDVGVGLWVASAGNQSLDLHVFPDDSAGRTLALGAPGTAMAPFEEACVNGSSGSDQLIGHRVASILRGMDGDDELVARAGLTIMEGGPGADVFRTAGFTLIRLPAADVASGETIDCRHAERVHVDSTLTRAQLEAAGVSFLGCPTLEEPCPEPAGGFAGEEFDEDCHDTAVELLVADLGTADGPAGVHHAQGLGVVADYGPGFGTCNENQDCYTIGLDVCRDPQGNEMPATNGRCYPSDFDAFAGSLPEWCNDPFWARYRYDELQAAFQIETRKLVVPVTFWLPRSDALNSDGSCSIEGHAGAKTIQAWNNSITKWVQGAIQYWTKWGVSFDYRVRFWNVPSDSVWIADPATDACNTSISKREEDDNSVGDLVEAYPTKYAPKELNIYLSDTGGSGGTSRGDTANGKAISFIILYKSAAPFAHEAGHQMGLPHPYANNVNALGSDPDNAESRDTFAARPFPGHSLFYCSGFGQCAGAEEDVEVGVCLIGTGQSLGFCQNLKADCGNDGDHVCDTPWDARPCFSGVDHHVGDPCVTNDDCHGGGGARGTSYMTECGSARRCVKVNCVDDLDCDGGSFCADGTCVIYKSGGEACCELHTDIEPAFDHNVCYERDQMGNVGPVDGVGPGTWPHHQNVMAYHVPFQRPRTLTEGQRDQVVCKLSYKNKWGLINRDPRPDGEPCTLRTAASPFFYGNVGQTKKIAHGGCESGVCQLTQSGIFTLAQCVPASCSDGILGNGEASIDCGGVCAGTCPTARLEDPKGSACFTNADCFSGVCELNRCQPTCGDGQLNGSEVAQDSGGVSFDPACAQQLPGERCRFDLDCTFGNACAGAGDCRHAVDCPVNDVPVPCLVSADCLFGTCKRLDGICNASPCTDDSDCATGFCQAAGRCNCLQDSDCDLGDTCQVLQSACFGLCQDGRCLGRCGP